MMPDGHHPSFGASFRYALSGIATALRTERNIKVMLVIAAVAVIAGLVLRLDAPSWVAVIIMIGIVLCAELLNTALESVVDLVSPDEHPQAKRAKDLAAGAELILCICVAVAGLVVYVRAGLILFGVIA